MTPEQMRELNKMLEQVRHLHKQMDEVEIRIKDVNENLVVAREKEKLIEAYEESPTHPIIHIVGICVCLAIVIAAIL